MFSYFIVYYTFGLIGAALNALTCLNGVKVINVIFGILLLPSTLTVLLIISIVNWFGDSFPNTKVGKVLLKKVR